MNWNEAFYQIARRGEAIVRAPVYLARIVHFLWLRLTGATCQIGLRFGPAPFRMHVAALGPRQGARGIFLFREHYEPLLQHGAHLVHPGDVVFDLGANQGVYTCAFASAVGGRGRVVALEPIPHQAARVRANVALNGFENCTVVEKAISDRAGAASLHMGFGDTAASLIDDGQSSIEVKTTTVDLLVDELGLQRVDFIKLDVEGAEMMALRGAERTLRRFGPGLAVEAADPVLFQEIRAFLTGLGYEFCVFDGQGGLKSIAALGRLEDNVICLREKAPVAPAVETAKV